MAGTSIITKTGDMVSLGAARRRSAALDYVCVLAFVDRTAPKTLALPVRDAFDPRLPSAEVRVVGVGSGTDLLALPFPTCAWPCWAATRRAYRLASASLPQRAFRWPWSASLPSTPLFPLARHGRKRVSVISATNAEVLTDRLAEWLVDATDKSIALAANFAFCRRAKVRELINDFAMENAMGTAKLGPGAELPSMTLNQARLALDIAAINGQPLALGRVPEVLSAIGAGFGSRMFANKALGRIPLFGWLFQAGFGYLGTQATGLTLQRRFDKKERKASRGGAPPEHARMAASSAHRAQRRASQREAKARQVPLGQGAPAPEAATR